ncbi:MAG TPA: multidrug effflux MFS transporter [Propionicimonas sp.]|jgi:DHA1 family bicyclomycin/chloramphenicol resistance-like MFS transporter|uniref:multidrug effflux MFS transporter n=1 Tax=Propionicimonas sp. TaxID=1955623 RepID=UPI002F405D28
MTALPPQASTPQQSAVGPQWLFLLIMAGLGMVGPFSIDTIFPAFAQMQREWGSSELALQQLISVYLLSFAVMSLLHGPLSDALGRKPVIIGGTILFIAASIGCALSPSLPVLLFFRAIQGLSAGAGQIISRAMVRDVFSDDQAQRTMSHIAMIFGLAPALAPIVGGWLLGIGSWRGIFWFLVGFGVVILLLVIFALAETHPPELRSTFDARTLVSGLVGVWRNPDGRRLAFTGMFNFAGMFLYISSAPLFVLKLLGKGEQDFWILFVPLISGLVLGSWVSGRLAGRMSGRRLASLGYVISLVGGLVNLVFSLFPATQALPWAVVPLPVYSFGIAIAFPILTLAMLDLFPNARGSASSVQSFVALIANALIAGVLAPAVAFSQPSLAVTALALTTVAWFLWRRHLQKTHAEPTATPDAPAYEPTDEM